VRLKLTLRPESTGAKIPLGYNSALSEGIRSCLTSHFRVEDPAFVFSRLLIKSKLFDSKTSTIRILSPTVTLYVGLEQSQVPLDADLTQVIGCNVSFGLQIESVMRMPVPAMKRTMSFRMLSPTAVSSDAGDWLAADDGRVAESLRKVLLKRYNSVRKGQSPVDPEFDVQMEDAYLTSHGGAGGVRKIMHLPSSAGSEQHVEAFLCPITLSGSPDLIEFAYHSGLGEFTSFGLGMMA
jgi:CRISPR-associated endoribonuclease Cas6